VLSARLAGDPVELDGVLVEISDASGVVDELTLLLRPFKALRAAIDKMADAPGATS
jgi:hypothetical protein